LKDIPFNRPHLTGREIDYVRQSLESGHLCGDGPFTERCQNLLEEVLGVPKVLLTTSCTHALEMAALLLGAGPGDEVVMPSYTFVSTANAFVLRGARPVFVDIRPDTLNLDEAKLESCLSRSTRAILPVHYAGVGCEMNEVSAIADGAGVAVVEDAAHGLFGRYRGRYLGTFGEMAAVSFHETKNFASGEGGALLINDPRYAEDAEIVREKGTNRQQFFRGQVDKYTWVRPGSSYLPSDILAAVLLPQLEAREHVTDERRRVYDRYALALGEWAADNDVELPVVPAHCDPPFHMFYLLMPSLELQQRLIAHLTGLRIQSAFHYVPLHLSPMGLELGNRPGDLPVTEELAGRIVRLPFYADLTDADLGRVCDAVTGFSC
jgi:dTDP-4-amino-4,6-dideoxygalactose transaminase